MDNSTIYHGFITGPTGITHIPYNEDDLTLCYAPTADPTGCLSLSSAMASGIGIMLPLTSAL